MQFSLRPFKDSYSDFLHCSLQLGLLSLCLGGLLRKWAAEVDRGQLFNADLDRALGNLILYFTLVWSFSMIVWAVLRDLTVALGRKHILQNITSTTGTTLDLFKLSAFDTGLNTEMLHSVSSASERMVQLYLEMRGCVGQAPPSLASLFCAIVWLRTLQAGFNNPFWLGKTAPPGRRLLARLEGAAPQASSHRRLCQGAGE